MPSAIATPPPAAAPFRPLRLPATLVVVAVAACFWAFDLGVLRAGAPDLLDDTWEYGVAARHVLAGDGFRTSVIHPPVWSLRDSALTVPVLIHGPLLPLLLAPAIAARGPGALEGIAWLAALFATIGAGATWTLGRRLGGAAVGAAAAIVWTLSPAMLHAVHHDASLVVGGALLALAFEAATREGPDGLATGLWLGLAWLARPEMALAAFVLVALVGDGERGRFTLAALVCAGPWLAHNALATGSPMFNLSSYLVVGYSERWPELRVLRDFDLTPDRWFATLRECAPWLPEKWKALFPHAAKRALLFPTAATGWLAIVGALVALARREHRAAAIGAAALAAIPVAVMTATVYDARYLVPFLSLWSLAVAYGARGLPGALPAWARTGRVTIGLVLLLLLPSALPALREEARAAGPARARLASERAALLAHVAEPPDSASRAPVGAAGPPRPLFSDTPDFAAWITGRPVVWVERFEYARLPARPDSGRDVPARGTMRDVWFHDPRQLRPVSGSSP